MSAPFFKRGEQICDALFDKNRMAQQAADRTFSQGPIEVQADIWSHDPRLIGLKGWLSLKGSEIPINVDDMGRVYGNGVRSNFHGLRHINGFPMLPATWPLTSNIKKREDQELVNKWVKPWHERLFRSFVRLAFTGLEAVPFKVRKGSSTCCPYFVKDMELKLALARRHLAEAKAAGELMLAGDFQKAWLLYQIGGAYYIVYRSQSSDGISYEKGVWVPKVRPVADFDYAVSGGSKGKVSPADKTFDSETVREFGIEGSIEGFFRERRRTAMGGPWGINSILGPIAQSVRKHLYDTYAYSFHHTTRTQKEDGIRDWSMMFATDVSDHDINFPTFIIDTMAEELLNLGYAEWWVKIFETSFRLPIYVTSPGPDQGQTLLGDWTKPDLRVGLSSGNSFTDIMGTANMAHSYAVMQIEHTVPRIERMLEKASQFETDMWLDSYLKGKEVICQKSKSDDALLGWRDVAYNSEAEKLMARLANEEQVAPYNKIGLERGYAFLGDILLYGQDKSNKNVMAVANPISMLVNEFCPEYSVNSKIKDRTNVKRPFPMLAWETMNQVYGTMPTYGQLRELVSEGWWKFFGYSYDQYREDGLRREKLALAQQLRDVADLTPAYLGPNEVEAMINPDKLQYKFSDTDVNPDVAAMFIHQLSVEEVKPFFDSVVPRRLHA
jgi:hypothetical protein